MANFVLVAAFRRLRWLLQAAPRGVVKPTMIETAQPAILYPAVTKIGAAMCAVEAEQAWPTALVAKQDQLLAQNPDRYRCAAELLGKRDRMPVTAHESTTGSIRTGEGKQPIIFLGEHRWVSLPL